jgi:hypothetical protein
MNTIKLLPDNVESYWCTFPPNMSSSSSLALDLSRCKTSLDLKPKISRVENHNCAPFAHQYPVERREIDELELSPRLFSLQRQIRKVTSPKRNFWGPRLSEVIQAKVSVWQLVWHQRLLPAPKQAEEVIDIVSTFLGFATRLRTTSTVQSISQYVSPLGIVCRVFTL